MIISEKDADWRYSKVFRVNGDQVVWGQFVKDGTLGWLISNTEAKRIGEISFPTPDPAAMAFSIAFDSARAAGALWKQISLTGRNVRHGSVPALYAYFEQSMTAAVFSFQCVEAYANHKISDLAKEAMEVPRKEGRRKQTPYARRTGTKTEHRREAFICVTKADVYQIPKGNHVGFISRIEASPGFNGAPKVR